MQPVILLKAELILAKVERRKAVCSVDEIRTNLDNGGRGKGFHEDRSENDYEEDKSMTSCGKDGNRRDNDKGGKRIVMVKG